MKTPEYWRKSFTFGQLDELIDDYEILLDMVLSNEDEKLMLKARLDVARTFLRLERKKGKRRFLVVAHN